jgi:hypothetical protein
MLTAARAERDTAIAAKVEELRADEIDRLDMLTEKVSALMEPRPGKRGKMVEPDPWLLIKAALAIKAFGDARAKLYALNMERASEDFGDAKAAAGEELIESLRAGLDKIYGRSSPSPGEEPTPEQLEYETARRRKSIGYGKADPFESIRGGEGDPAEGDDAD